MRQYRMLLCAGAALCAQPAIAADALKFGAAPAWVHPRAIPAGKPTEAPVSLLLDDVQVRLERGKVTTYSEGAIKFENAQGLAAGNVAVAWQPATDTVTINKLQIRRGDKVIDVLAAGQTFTTLRRETNLDAATLDGTLTATLQPEGLQVGDIIHLATTTERSDPVLKGHVEAMFAAWDALPIQAAHAALSWPGDVRLQLRQTPNLPAVQKSSSGGMTLAEISGEGVQPLVPPKGAPERFTIGRLAEATDFTSWSDLANLFVPLFRDASAIPASGPLHDEVEKIRVASSNPKTRAELALTLVQDRVRYVALLMGQGGYVPAPAETTWSRRFGDCKGKTALLLGILHSLGIEAEPVLAQTKVGDMVADRLPMIALFNHVLVRAHVGGKDYWLDGTRTGDTDLDSIEVPDFGWGLPLVANAKLVRMVPAPLTVPKLERHVSVDASGGVYAPAAITIDELYRGDRAVGLNAAYSAVTAAQRDEQMHDEAKSYFDSFTVTSSSLQFDKAKRELRITIKGTAKLNWKDSWFFVPISSVGFDPDFDRAAGPLHDAPWSVSHPRFVKDQLTIRLPSGFAAMQKLNAPVHETLAGVEYVRTETVSRDTLTIDSSERSIAAEVPYKDALVAAARLKTLDKDDVYLNVPTQYRPTDKDVAALQDSTPSSANDYFTRAGALFAHNKVDEALADLDAGLALDPKSSWALMKRAAVYERKQRFQDAEKDLATAQSIDPANANVTASWGELAMSKGNIDSAMAAFDKALDRDPKNTWAREKRAEILLQQGKLDEALKEFAAVLALDANNTDALAKRAFVLASRSDWAGAERDVAAALAADPADATALATKALIAVWRKDYKAAKEFASKALASDPTNSYARNLQAQLLKREGNQTAAMKMLDQAIANAPRSAEPLLSRAFAHLQAKEFEAADKDLAAALKLDPTNLQAMQGRAVLAAARGDFTGEAAAWTTLLKTSPSNGLMLAARADAYRRLKKFDEAIADTEAALKTGLTSPELRLLRINILVGKGDMLAVASEADQLVKENSTSDLALVAAGKTYAALGMREKAMTSFDRALAMRPQAYIYINRSQVRSFADVQGKLADLDAALKLEPDQEDALVLKANLLSKAGKHAEAIQLYDQAIKSALDSSYLELGRAIVVQKAGRTAEAKAAMDAVRAKAKTAGDFERMCRAKANQDVWLESAVRDCRQALQMDANYPGLHEDLGIALLKSGKLRDALAELDKAVASKGGADSQMARAIVRSKLGDSAGARADAAEAHRVRADIDDTFAEYGLKFENSAPAQVSAAH